MKVLAKEIKLPHSALGFVHEFEEAQMTTRIVRSDHGWKKLWIHFSRPNFICSAATVASLKNELLKSNGIYLYLSSFKRPCSFAAAGAVSKASPQTVKVHFYLLPTTVESVQQAAAARLFAGVVKYGKEFSYKKVLVPCLIDPMYSSYHEVFSRGTKRYRDELNNDIVWYELDREYFEELSSVRGD